MTMLTRTLALAAAALATSAAAQPTGASAPTARAVRGASPYVAIENEPPPRLIVDPPLPEGLPLGVYWAQYRVENLRIAQVFGPGARQVSPRVGHLHVIDGLVGRRPPGRRPPGRRLTSRGSGPGPEVDRGRSATGVDDVQPGRRGRASASARRAASAPRPAP